MKHEENNQSKIFHSQMTINSVYVAADAIKSLHSNGQLLDVGEIMDELLNKAQKVDKNNLIEIENMLFFQAKTLEYLFYDALKKLVDLNMMDHIQMYIDIAFKAQALSRKTLMALVELKHPRHLTFIKQQNNAINQQINNEAEFKNKKSKKNSNELLRGSNHASLDTSGEKEAIIPLAQFKAMDKINRS